MVMEIHSIYSLLVDRKIMYLLQSLAIEDTLSYILERSHIRRHSRKQHLG